MEGGGAKKCCYCFPLTPYLTTNNYQEGPETMMLTLSLIEKISATTLGAILVQTPTMAERVKQEGFSHGELYIIESLLLNHFKAFVCNRMVTIFETSKMENICMPLDYDI